MRSRFLFYIFLFLLSSLAIGCYDDEGNYDYKTINEVAVKLEETSGFISMTPKQEQVICFR